MKKILIPILTTAAIAPVATTMVACGSTISTTIDLEFTEESELFERPAFVIANAHITAGRKYIINIDLSKASDQALKDFWIDFDEEHFMAFLCLTSNPSAEGTALTIDVNKSKIILNDKDVTQQCKPYKHDGIIGFKFFSREWKKTDKLKYEVVWTDNTNKGTLIFTRFFDPVTSL